MFIGINGMRQHLAAGKKHIPITRWRLYVNLRTAVDIDRVENGKIVEHGGEVNTFDALG